MIKQLFLSAFLIGGTYLVSPWIYTYSPFYHATTKAIALINPTKDQTVTGTVTFEQVGNSVHIIADCQGLTPGKHGFHIHTYGACNCPDAICAGDHYDPTYQPHGGPNSERQHVGDLGNIEADSNGNAHLDITVSYMSLNGCNSVIGRTVIVHQDEDNLVAQPTGNSGKRIGCGVIGIAAPK